MFDIHHAINIRAPRMLVFCMLTNIDLIEHWHGAIITGKVEVGEKMILTPKIGVSFTWITESIDYDTSLLLKDISNGQEKGKFILFELFSLKNGMTKLRLSDGPWPSKSDDMAHCNTQWGAALERLKIFIELEYTRE